jgi:glycosyltransferase involved in cell wall biosynthesis
MSERARLYWRVRTAHLERAAQLPDSTIYYAGTRSDFDPELAARSALVPAPGLRAALLLLRNPPAILEVNEPLMYASAIWTAATLAILDLGRVVGRRRSTVVTYAIENLNPFTGPATNPVKWVKRLARAGATRFAWHRVDRIVYGTQAAQELYQQVFGAGRAATALIPALPARPSATPPKVARSALFVSSFVQRKGIPTLLDAWPAVREALPDASLTLIGKGPLLERVQAAAASDPSLRVLVDPPRPDIHRALAAAQVVVLPSQPTATWREQVGLPIVEGLTNGCTIVTTTETGLASWLDAHGHHVVPRPGDSGLLAAAIIAALAEPLDPELVGAALPPEDGRLAADEWLFRA